MLHRRTMGLIGNSAAVVTQLEGEVGDRKKLALIYNGVELPPLVAAAIENKYAASCTLIATLW